MKEYKFIVGNTSECQKKLNQWRHEFKLEVLQMIEDTTAGCLIILITRERKN